MKTLYYYALIAILTIASCKSNIKPVYEKTAFAIYRTVEQKEISGSTMEELKQTQITIDPDSLSPIIAYVNSNSIMVFPETENVKLLTTVFPVDNEKKYLALVAITTQPVLTNSDVKRTKPNGKNIEIYFNLNGAKKWADLTKNSVGSMIAFTINDRIYTLTSVNGEIRNGIAVINGLENEDMADRISKSINASLRD